MSDNAVESNLRVATERYAHSATEAIQMQTTAIVALVHQVGAIVVQLKLLNEKFSE